jgi:hypothetical protein
MKSFNQFLNESYFSEAEVGRQAGRRPPGGPSVEDEKAKINAKAAEKAAKDAARGPTGAAARPDLQFRRQGTTTNVPGSSVRGETGTSGTSGRSPKPYSGTTSSSARVEPAGAGNSQQAPSKPAGAPSRTQADLEKTLASRRAARKASQVKGGELALRPQGSSAISSAAKEAEKTAAKTATKGVGKGILKGLGRIAGPASAALDVADERSKGSGWARSLAKGAAVAAGGAVGGTVGSVAGPVGSVGGAVGGSMAASKAFDVAAGANAKERKGMATANRQRQAGTSVKGIGGSTSFSQKKPGGPAFMSTGVGKQRKTAQLAKTGVVQRGGQSVAGNLAFKKGQAVYKAGPSAKSLAKTSSNPLERVGRSLFAGAYKKFDAANAAKKLATARSSDSARSRKLGVKKLPGK